MSDKDWINSLQKELKTDLIDQIVTRTSFEGYQHSILPHTDFTHSVNYQRSPLSILVQDWMTPDVWEDFYQRGVGDFIIREISSKNQESLVAWMQNHPLARLFTNQDKGFGITALSVKDQLKFGCSQIEQARKLFQHWKGEPREWIEFYIDDQIFINVALIRALRFLTQSHGVKILGRIHLKNWSWIDEEMNVLRNSSSVLAGYLAGVDGMESAPYHLLTHKTSAQAQEASWLSLTTQLILQAESFLQFKNDPARGSYALESMSEDFIHKLQETTSVDGESFQTEMRQQMRSRKKILTGVNDFSPRELVMPQIQGDSFFRLALEFEKIRQEFHALSEKPKLGLVVIGSLEKNQPRLVFAQNILDLLGGQVEEIHLNSFDVAQFNDSIKRAQIHYQVIITDDETLKSIHHLLPSDVILVTRLNLGAYKRLYMGMDVIEFFNHEIKSWSHKI